MPSAFDPDDSRNTGKNTAALAQVIEQTDGDDWDLRTIAIDSNGNQVDQDVVNIRGDDQAGNTAQVQAEELGGTIGGGETALFTILAEALSGVANQQLRVDLQNDNLTTNLDVDIAEDSLNGLTVTDNGSFNVAGTVTTTDDGNFNTTLDSGTVSQNATSLAADASQSFSVGQPGADRLDLRVDRSSNYSVDYEVKDGAGNTQFTVQLLASGSGERTAGTTEVYPNADITINDEASASATFSLEAHQR